MNKFIVVLALVAACVAVASANHRHNKHHKHQGHHGHQGHDHHDSEFELEHDDFDRFGGHEDRDFDRFGHGHGHSHGSKLGGFRGHRGGLDRFEHGTHGGHGFRAGRRGGFGGHGLERRSRIGGVRGNQGNFNNFDSRNHLDSDRFQEGHEGSFQAGNKQFNADRNRNDVHDREGRRKNKVINKDLTIIKNKEQGFDDESEFKNHDQHSDGAHIGASKTNVAAHEQGGSAGNKLDIDRELSGSNGQQSSFAAGGASI